MTDSAAFAALSPTTLADVLGRAQIMRLGIAPLWAGMPRVAGPAFPVRCPPGDNLMLHAAIYRAPIGSIIVVAAGDCDYAVAGGNVCRTAQRHGITAFVIDGVIRDLGEVREARFPVFARGVQPIPGVKGRLDAFNQPVVCGGVTVNPGDLVVADEEGIVVVPSDQANAILLAAQQRAAKDAAETLDEWEASHRKKIDALLAEKGFTPAGPTGG